MNAKPLSPPQQTRSIATDRKLLSAVCALLRSKGLSGVTTPAVAEQAGVAVGTIYRRYPDKQTLVAAAILDFVTLEDGRLDSVYADIASNASSLRDFLKRVAQITLSIASEDRVFLTAVREFARSTTDSVWKREYEAQQGRGRAIVKASALARFRAELRGREQALSIVLASIYGIANAAFIEPVAGLFDACPNPDALAEELANMGSVYLLSG